jgi:hypothetical protein
VNTEELYPSQFKEKLRNVKQLQSELESGNWQLPITYSSAVENPCLGISPRSIAAQPIYGNLIVLIQKVVISNCSDQPTEIATY